MAEVLDETLTTKEETKKHENRHTRRSTSGRIPQKRRSTRRTASQAQKAAGAQANDASNHSPDTDHHPGNDAAAQPGNGETGESGIERLSGAADKVLGEECAALTKALTKRAMEGHASATRLLYILANRKKPRKAPLKNPRGLTLAQMLSAEPQWKVEEKEQPQQAAESGGAGELVNNGG